MRTKKHDVLHEQFINRWSPRSFTDEPVPEAELMAMFEAAKWSPSCFNEQPWRFVFASSDEDKARFLDILVEANQAWARNAPVLVCLFAKNYFDLNKEPNDSFAFDAGAAWMAFSLQARSRGYYTHAMAGFEPEKAYAVCGVDPSHYKALVVFAVGKIGEPEQLPDALRKMESPNDRHDLSRLVFEGHFDSSVDK